MIHLPKKCGDCRFYHGERHLMSDPNRAVHGCEIMLYLGQHIPAHLVKDEAPLDCPLANQFRFKTLCKECMIEDYNSASELEDYSVQLPLFYNGNVALTLDYLGGRIEKNPTVEKYLENKNLFGRKPDTGYYRTVNLKTGETTDVGHQYDPIKDQEARMTWAREKAQYTLRAENSFYTNKVEVWQNGTIKQVFFLPDGVTVLCVSQVTGRIQITKGDTEEHKEWKPLFEVIVGRGRVVSWTDFQIVKGPKPTLESRVEAIEQYLSLK
jgi:hypothetical protein